MLKKNIYIHLADPFIQRNFKLYSFNRFMFQTCNLDVLPAEVKKKKHIVQYAEIKVDFQRGIEYVCIMSSSCIIDWLCCLEV